MISTEIFKQRLKLMFSKSYTNIFKEHLYKKGVIPRRVNPTIKNNKQVLVKNNKKALVRPLKLRLKPRLKLFAKKPAKKPPKIPPKIPEKIPVHVNTNYALLIGINYIGSPNQLNGCINDMYNMNAYLLTKKYDSANIVLLSDAKTTGVRPTKAVILNEIKTILQKAQSGDNCVISYSGHGGQLPDNNGDEDDTIDECLFSCNLEAIRDDDIKKIIQQYLKPGVTLFCLIDSCHSGTMLDLRYNYKYNQDNNLDYVNSKETETAGNVYMISGCMDSQTSTDAYLNGKYCGALTNAFLKNVRTSTSWDSLLNNMKAVLISNNFEQVPQLSSGLPLDISTALPF